MKNLTKQFLILIFLFALLINNALAQNNISVFNSPVTLHAPMVKGEFPSGYPISIGASKLRDCVARGVSRADLREIYDAVAGSVIQQNIPKGTPVLGAFFTTQYGADTLAIIRNLTHGFCFAFHDVATLTLYFYEVNALGKYDRVDNLTTRINSFSEDLFLSLQYSHFSPGTFPDRSTVFRFICDTLGKASYTDSSDVSVALSKDYKRQTGLFSLGMACTPILVSLESPNGGTSNCGNECNMVVANTHCITYTDDFQTTYNCGTLGTGCAAGAIERRAKDENIALGVPLNFKMMRDFRDKFMVNYCEGRKYTGFYYVFSKYARMNISMLWKYASLLPELYTAMDNLSDVSGNKIIVTPSLKEKVLEILHDHQNLGDAYFQSILKQVEADMELYEGLKRADLISMLSPYGNCSGQRKMLSGSRSDNSYFVSVYDNPEKVEIVVNYSVPGSKVRFELYNVDAVLVSSIDNSSPKQKFSLSTSALLPGVYICRIISDSGYERINKVVVIK
ncbi:MAG: T9SS type A sorting domain-containing protein [Bacteroidota bacterium]